MLSINHTTSAYKTTSTYIPLPQRMAQGAKKAIRREDEGERYRREVAARVYDAFRDYNAKRPKDQELTQAELGRRVGAKMKRDAVPQGTVSRWMNPSNPAVTDNPTLRVIAEVLETDVMWILYGAMSD